MRVPDSDTPLMAVRSVRQTEEGVHLPTLIFNGTGIRCSWNLAIRFSHSINAAVAVDDRSHARASIARLPNKRPPETRMMMMLENADNKQNHKKPPTLPSPGTQTPDTPTHLHTYTHTKREREKKKETGIYICL
ncbi:hypothetical protein VTH06DRAFT_1225 [Thermothelomyces fergusii]